MCGISTKLPGEGQAGCRKNTCIFTMKMVKVVHRHKLPGEMIDTLCLSMFKRYLDNALNNMFQLLVSPEVVGQWD